MFLASYLTSSLTCILTNALPCTAVRTSIMRASTCMYIYIYIYLCIYIYLYAYVLYMYCKQTCILCLSMHFGDCYYCESHYYYVLLLSILKCMALYLVILQMSVGIWLSLSEASTYLTHMLRTVPTSNIFSDFFWPCTLRNLSDSCFDTCSCAVCGVCSDNLSGFLLAACDIRQSIWQIFASSGKLRRSMFCLATASKQVEIDLLSYFFRGLTFFYPGHVSKYLPGC